MSGPRRLIALAGPPGAGKSTVAPLLAGLLSGRVVPMDGFHLDNGLLDARGMRARKGAPETFDTAGLAHALTRLKSGEDEVILPAFDRDRDAAIAGAIRIGPEDRLLVVEGNYLLAALPGWETLAGLWDAAVLLTVPQAVIEARLRLRWQAEAPDMAQARLANDLANAATVAATARGDHARLADDGAAPEVIARRAADALRPLLPA